jgi:hypothetical protein
MSFADREYDVYVILGNPFVIPAWAEPTWTDVASVIGPLLKCARGPAAVRSAQLSVGTGSPNKREVSFGRVSWNAAGHRKWVHPAPSDQNRLFVNVEMWAPSWSTVNGSVGRQIFSSVLRMKRLLRQKCGLIPWCCWLSHGIKPPA